jgi:hypothetical protein
MPHENKWNQDIPQQKLLIFPVLTILNKRKSVSEDFALAAVNKY